MVINSEKWSLHHSSMNKPYWRASREHLEGSGSPGFYSIGLTDHSGEKQENSKVLRDGDLLYNSQAALPFLIDKFYQFGSTSTLK